MYYEYAAVFYHIGTLLVTRLHLPQTLEVTLQVHETNVVILTPKCAALLEFEQWCTIKFSIDCGCVAAINRPPSTPTAYSSRMVPAYANAFWPVRLSRPTDQWGAPEHLSRLGGLRNASRMNTQATTQHHSQGCNFPIHYSDSLNSYWPACLVD